MFTLENELINVSGIGFEGFQMLWAGNHSLELAAGLELNEVGLSALPGHDPHDPTESGMGHALVTARLLVDYHPRANGMVSEELLNCELRSTGTAKFLPCFVSESMTSFRHTSSCGSRSHPAPSPQQGS